MGYIIVFAIIFLLNVIPFFAPATWTVLSFIAVRYNYFSILELALVGAIAATCGRVVLAYLARIIVRQNFLSEKMKKNIDDLKRHLEKRTKLTFGIFLAYALTPLPSNQLFIAY